MKLHRDLGVRARRRLFMLHRFREAFADVSRLFDGPVEVDETYVGGIEKNKHARKPLGQDHWSAKIAVVGMKDRGTR